MIAAIGLAVFAFAVSLLTLFSGFGLGTLLLPAFALVLPVEVAVAATAVVHAANNLFKAGLLARSATRDVVVRFGAPAVVASFVGAIVLTQIASDEPVATWQLFGRTARVTVVKSVMGALILVFALLELVPALRALRAPVRWMPVGGALSGFFGGLSGHQGALRAIFLSPLGLGPEAFASTQAVIALMVDGARLLVYGFAFVVWRGTSTPVPWGLVAVVSLAAFAGAFTGKRILPKVTVEALHLVVGGLLVVVGVALGVGLV